MPHPKTSGGSLSCAPYIFLSAHWRWGCSCMNWCGDVWGLGDFALSLFSFFFFLVWVMVEVEKRRGIRQLLETIQEKLLRFSQKQLLNFSHRREEVILSLLFHSTLLLRQNQHCAEPITEEVWLREWVLGGSEGRGMDRMTSQCCYPPCSLESTSFVSKPVSPFVNNNGLGSWYVLLFD